jgi:hypothetical protein
MRTEQERSLTGGGGGDMAGTARTSLRQMGGGGATESCCDQGRASPLRASRPAVMDANLALLI